ncbi:hypothetical protein SELSPUOL_02571 [Selenomonas sputigena ATCC 35185]|uniref:Uncharacterized protein n=1 Tax=Selenomonas sputigena (strain ATCC 35185 / DSM 20758 / CCUG 44933 / VPI D19B-28) TaxID=546271 RepID=C9LYL0_SELS3|nr:hypothetical protein SELSPUOL_02571 [Selenomonas sputigena ATCC 35185]
MNTITKLEFYQLKKYNYYPSAPFGLGFLDFHRKFTCLAKDSPI